LLTDIDEDVLKIQGGGWSNVVLAGELKLTTNNPMSAAVIRAEAEGDAAHTLLLAATAKVTSEATAAGGFALGIDAGGAAGSTIIVRNDGAVSVHGTSARGVVAGEGGFENGGSITVDAVGNAMGVLMSSGGAFLNTGTITVNGGFDRFTSGVGVFLTQAAGSYEAVNTGAIKAAISPNPFATTTGVLVGGYTHLTNSGLIEGKIALMLARDPSGIGGGRFADVTNSGTLHGTVNLNNTTTEPVTLTNTGLIDGNVALNDGADTYSGVSGTASGSVDGGAGDDVLAAGKGATTLLGGAGNDTLAALYNTASVNGGAGDDLIQLTGVHWTDDLRLTRLDGGDGNDVFEVVALPGRHVAIDGGAGRNSLVMHGLDPAGADALVLRLDGVSDSQASAVTNVQTVVAPDHAATILGGAADETLSASGSITGGGGNDTITSLGGASTLFGGDGTDSIAGGAGFDQVNGNLGDDTIVGGSAVGDWLLGGQGADRIDASQSQGRNIINGNIGADTVTGGSGADTMRGGQGDDQITAGVGNDWIAGDLGANMLTGGDGADVFRAGSGSDTVTDFSAGGGDRVEVIAGVTYTATQSGGDVQIAFSNGGQMILQGQDLASLPNGWIVVV
jgi:Ca2+-binding RTX toxin-like protein